MHLERFMMRVEAMTSSTSLNLLQNRWHGPCLRTRSCAYHQREGHDSITVKLLEREGRLGLGGRGYHFLASKVQTEGGAILKDDNPCVRGCADILEIDIPIAHDSDESRHTFVWDHLGHCIPIDSRR